MALFVCAGNCPSVSALLVRVWPPGLVSRLLLVVPGRARAVTFFLLFLVDLLVCYRLVWWGLLGIYGGVILPPPLHGTTACHFYFHLLIECVSAS